MEIHIHIHQHADPAEVAQLTRIADAVEKVVAQDDISTRLEAAANKLKGVNDKVDAAVAANPDPDPTD